MIELKLEADYFYLLDAWEATYEDLCMIDEELKDYDRPQEIGMLKKDGSFWAFYDWSTGEMRAFKTEKEAIAAWNQRSE